MESLAGIGILFWANVIFLLVHPLFVLQLFLPSTWSVTFVSLAWTSPHRRSFKWWLFMPLTALAGAITGTFMAGLLMWVPTIVLADFHLPRGDELTWSILWYLAFGGGVSGLLSFHYARRLDRRLHD